MLICLLQKYLVKSVTDTALKWKHGTRTLDSTFQIKNKPLYGWKENNPIGRGKKISAIKLSPLHIFTALCWLCCKKDNRFPSNWWNINSQLIICVLLSSFFFLLLSFGLENKLCADFKWCILYKFTACSHINWKKCQDSTYKKHSENVHYCLCHQLANFILNHYNRKGKKWKRCVDGIFRL